MPLKKSFAPEFLNRIDDVILFNSLTKDDIFLIIDIELEKLYDRIKGLGYELSLTEEAKNFVAEKGFDIKFGARPLARAIQKYIEDPLAEEIINSKIKEGDVIELVFNKKEGELNIKTKSPKNSGKDQKSPPKEVKE